jgi:hypothetical protein
MNGLISMVRSVMQDLRHGKDVELYVTVPLAAIVISANLLGKASLTLVSAVTLTLLTLLVIALLKLRKQNDQLFGAIERLDRPENSVGRLFRDEHSVEEAKELIKNARHEIWLWGSILATHIATLSPYIERAVIRGLVVKVLLIKPPLAMLWLWPFFERGTPMTRNSSMNLMPICTG